MTLLKKEKEIVIPGEKIVESMEYLPGRNCFREGDIIYSKKIGILNLENRVISVIPLTGRYIAYPGDMVIGEIDDILPNGWFVNIDSCFTAYLPISGVRGFIKSGTDLSRIYGPGEKIYAKVDSATSQGINITMQDSRARKLKEGSLIKISPVKVPRLIGKKGSMIAIIKNSTDSNIYVGQNGFVYVHGGNIELVEKAVKLIEDESHKEGLTEKMEKFLNGGKK